MTAVIPGAKRGARPGDRRVHERLQYLAELLDDRFSLPGTNFRFGLDGLIGLVPGIGDTVMSGVGCYVVAEAWRLGCRKRTIARMLGNLGVDWLVGLVPVVGDLLDFGFKANRRNLQLALDELRQHRHASFKEGA